MAATYSGDPSASRGDEVRFLLQDTAPASALLSDEEISYVDARLQAAYDDALMTAAFCADIIAARYAGEASISADGVSISMAELGPKYQQLAANLRATYRSLRGLAGVPLVGGIDAFSRADASVRALNFGIGMDDNVRAGDQGLDGYPRYTGAEYESGNY